MRRPKFRSTTPASIVYTTVSLLPSDEMDDNDYSDSSAPAFYTFFESPNSFAHSGTFAHQLRMSLAMTPSLTTAARTPYVRQDLP